MCVSVGLMTHDMGQGTPLALDQDRRCQTLEAVQNTAEEVPRRAYYGDTTSKQAQERERETQINISSVGSRQIL